MFQSERLDSSSSLNRSASKTSNQRVVTPILLQTHVAECGAACLGSILGYFGRWVPLSELRHRCEVNRDGSSAAGIQRAAGYYGLDCTGRSVNIEDLKKLPMPSILFWNFNHFVILEGFNRNKFFINDPALGHQTVSAEEFNRKFTGIALEFVPRSDFEPGGNRINLLKMIPQLLKGTAKPLTYIALCGLILAIPALVTPAVLSIFMDSVLLAKEPWGASLAGILAASAVVYYLLTLYRKRLLKRLAIQVSVILGNQCISKMLRFPVEFFHHRLVGDLTHRVLGIDRLASVITNNFIELLIEAATSLIFLAVLFVYSPTLALIVLSLAAISAILSQVIIRIRLDKSFALRKEQGHLAGIGTVMLSHSESLRMTASDDHFFTRWSGQQAAELLARQELAEFSHINSALPVSFTILGNAAVLTFGSIQVISGNLTLGMVVGLYIVASMFLAPIGRFVEFTNERHVIEADLQRLEDIMDISDLSTTKSSSEIAGSVSTLDGRLKLTGQVEMRDITFGYDEFQPPTIKNFSLAIKPGERVAVVGLSGSGKSTLVRLLSGLYEPWSGEILYDGHHLHELPPNYLSRSLSVVDQKISLFSASVHENITLWNPFVPNENVVEAACDARIHHEIINRPQGYATKIDENGTNFSGGEKQRLQIARALANNPSVLILDEATSALDAATEELIDSAIRRRGITCVIIAHRLSTVRDADQIIVLDKSIQVQRGTHDELIRDGEGLYRRLVDRG